MPWLSVRYTFTASVSEPGELVRLLSSSALALRNSRSIAKADRSSLWLSLENSTKLLGKYTQIHLLNCLSRWPSHTNAYIIDIMSKNYN